MADGAGAALARAYYADVVAPLLADVPHAAGRLGGGSDVLGLDDDTSRDHDWGLRLTVLVDADRVADVAALLTDAVPPTYAGHPTRFAFTGGTDDLLRVVVDEPTSFVRATTGVDVAAGLDDDAWLALDGQRVLEVTAGPLFHDGPGAVTALRERLRWYPDHLWPRVVAGAWHDLGEELPFVGRTGQVGDDLGSRVVAARLAGTAMRLGFLLCRRWPPYAKWLGTLFRALPVAPSVAPHLATALAATDWRPRQDALATALESLHEWQRTTGLPTGAAATGPFWDRPFVGVRDEVERLLLG